MEGSQVKVTGHRRNTLKVPFPSSNFLPLRAVDCKNLSGSPSRGEIWAVVYTCHLLQAETDADGDQNLTHIRTCTY